MKTFPIDVGRCGHCREEFLYVVGKVNSISNRNSDLYGCPRCPTCSKYNTTTRVGSFEVHVWSVKR